MEAILLKRIQELTKPLSPSPPDHETRLKKLESVRCIAFDFYGTMFISGVGDIGIDEEQDTRHASFFEAALSDSGFIVNSQTAGVRGIELFQKTINRHINQKKDEGIEHPEPDIISVWLDVLNELSEKSLISGAVSKERAIRFAIEFEFRVNRVWPFPGLVQVLTKLLERGYTLGIISNSQFYTPLAFSAIIGKSPKEFGFDPDLLNWSYVSGLKKPDIRFYKLFTETLAQSKGLTPEEVLYVGNDIQKDIYPAKRLGMKTALFVGDSRSIRHGEQDLELEQYQPDIIIDSLTQIIECLDGR